MTRPFDFDADLLRRAKDHLSGLMGDEWSVVRVVNSTTEIDALWQIGHRTRRDPSATVLVDAKEDLTPRAAASITARMSGVVASSGHHAAVVVSPWLSERTRAVLNESGIGYLDLTGNVSIRLDSPLIVLRTDGAARNPNPAPEPRRGLTGASAGRLVRELVDFLPPRRSKELAAAADISEGYVSRLLDLMEREVMIERDAKVVGSIDWRALLVARGSAHHLMKVNRVTPMIARQGRKRLVEGLAAPGLRHQVLVTGSFAAAAFAPVSVGGALMAYVPPGPHVLDEVSRDLSLLPVDQVGSADILLMRPPNRTPFLRPSPERVEGVACVGLSQLVLDCLSGPGRMPAEGEALLDWMAHNESRWRRRSPLGQ